MIKPHHRAPEATLAASVHELLQALEPRGLVWRRTNSGMARRGKYFIKLAPPGTPDITGHLPNGRALYIELKAPGVSADSKTSKILWAAQDAFIAQAVACGCCAFKASTITEVALHLYRALQDPPENPGDLAPSAAAAGDSARDDDVAP